MRQAPTTRTGARPRADTRSPTTRARGAAGSVRRHSHQRSHRRSCRRRRRGRLQRVGSQHRSRWCRRSGAGGQGYHPLRHAPQRRFEARRRRDARDAAHRGRTRRHDSRCEHRISRRDRTACGRGRGRTHGRRARAGDLAPPRRMARHRGPRPPEPEPALLAVSHRRHDQPDHRQARPRGDVPQHRVRHTRLINRAARRRPGPAGRRAVRELDRRGSHAATDRRRAVAWNRAARHPGDHAGQRRAGRRRHHRRARRCTRPRRLHGRGGRERRRLPRRRRRRHLPPFRGQRAHGLGRHGARRTRRRDPDRAQ